MVVNFVIMTRSPHWEHRSPTLYMASHSWGWGGTSGYRDGRAHIPYRWSTLWKWSEVVQKLNAIGQWDDIWLLIIPNANVNITRKDAVINKLRKLLVLG